MRGVLQKVGSRAQPAPGGRIRTRAATAGHQRGRGGRHDHRRGLTFRGTPRTFGARSRSVEGVWGCSWALGLSTRDVRRAGTTFPVIFGGYLTSARDVWSHQMSGSAHERRRVTVR